MTLFEDLKWRGLIKDIAGEESELQKVLDGTPFTFYWGTDPTADSLHIGHYSSLCMAKRLANAGHHPILLCGGATGRIGDPRPTAEREIISEETVNKNIKGIHDQIDRLLDNRAELVDNYDWMKDYTFLNFLRDIGKYINVNYMLDKDIIRRRLEQELLLQNSHTCFCKVTTSFTCSKKKIVLCKLPEVTNGETLQLA
jgi:tyrosyl-tRNA synthetase